MYNTCCEPRNSSRISNSRYGFCSARTLVTFRQRHFSNFPKFHTSYSTFQNDCFASGILRENVDTEYRKFQIAKILWETHDFQNLLKFMRKFRVFQKLKNFLTFRTNANFICKIAGETDTLKRTVSFLSVNSSENKCFVSPGFPGYSPKPSHDCLSLIHI